MLVLNAGIREASRAAPAALIALLLAATMFAGCGGGEGAREEARPEADLETGREIPLKTIAQGTNSASGRFVPELVAGFTAAVERMRKVLDRLVVDRERMRANFAMSAETVIAEPLYVLLAYHGEPKAHESVRLLTLEAGERGTTLRRLLAEHPERFAFLEKITEEQRAVLFEPERYTGRATAKAEAVCNHWERRLVEMGL